MFCRLGSFDDSRPGRGRRQRVGRVDAMGLRMHVGRQRVGIGRFQFRNLPPFQDLLREFVTLLGELVEDLRRGRPRAGLGLGAAGNSHLAEQDVADLLGAADIDRLARDLLNFGFDPRGGLGEFARQPRQHLAVDRNAAAFHPRQHRDQRPLQRLIDRCHALGDQPRFQHAPQPQDHVGVLGRIGGRLVDRDLIETELALAAAGQFAMADGGMAEPASRPAHRARARCGRRRAHTTSAARRHDCGW